MNNFGRRLGKDQVVVTFVKSIYRINSVTIDSYVPPEDAVYEFSDGNNNLFVDITVNYSIYNEYSDGSRQFVSGGNSISARVTPVYISRYSDNISIVQSLSGAYGIKIGGTVLFYVETYCVDSYTLRIYKSDEDGTQVQTRLAVLVRSVTDYAINNKTSSIFAKCTLTKQGASGEGTVLRHLESL